MRSRLIFYITLVLYLMLPDLTVNAMNTREFDYTYDNWGNPVSSFPTFELKTVIDSTHTNGIRISGVNDIFTTEKRIYLLDTVEGRLNIFDNNYNFVTSIKFIRNYEGDVIIDEGTNERLMFTFPEGVFVKEATNEIYIADTGAERIIVLDGDKFYLERIIERPADMVGITVFRPSKIAVDNVGRIYAVVQGSHEGIVVLNSDGSFSRYFGVNRPRVDLVDFMWRTIATDEQREIMGRIYAPSFNNVDIDEEGFVYATTYDAAAVNMVFRLNARGENVLRGVQDVIGDIPFGGVHQASQFVDIAVTEFGAYALLDQLSGRVFIYNFDGELVDIFNRLGNRRGNVVSPSSIDWLGENLIIGDRILGQAFIFRRTEFGQVALDAVESYYNGEWDNAIKLFRKALNMNANFMIAYSGIGRNLLMQRDYTRAMHYLRLGDSRLYYSMAWNGYRNMILQQNFIWIALGIVLIVGKFIYSEYEYHRNIAKIKVE